MIAKSLLLLAFAALANCAGLKTYTCASTWTGKTLDLPICSTKSGNPEYAKQCLQAEVLGNHLNTYTMGSDPDDSDICITVVIRSLDRMAGVTETYVYRGPLSAFFTASCTQYCKGVKEAKDSFDKDWNTTLTPLYVSCLPAGTLNSEDLTTVVADDAAPTAFVCSDENNYAKDTNSLPKAPAKPTPPEAINLKLTVTPVDDPNSEYKSIPGWYLMSLGVQAAALAIGLIVFIYGIVLFMGYKSQSSIAPDNFEMK